MEQKKQQLRRDDRGKEGESARSRPTERTGRQAPQTAAGVLTAELLRSPQALRMLSPALLQRLAALLGNTGLCALLDGGGSPETYAFQDSGSSDGEPTVNRIHAPTPALTSAAGLCDRAQALCAPSAPDHIR